MANCLQVENLTKSFGDLVLFEDISFSVEQGERIGIVARNGAGKTTLLNIIAGREDFNSGAITPRRDISIAYLAQEPSFPKDISVLEACFHGDNKSLCAIAAYKKALLSTDADSIEKATNDMDSLSAWDYEQRGVQVLSRLNITNLNQAIGQLSGGQLKRVALAAALISEPDLLIMDEPTNHLDIDMTQWLADYLKRSRASLLLVTHDRWFLDSVTSDIIEIEDKRIYKYKGNYSYYLEKRQERLAAASSRRESEENLYKRELDWMRRQPQARATKAKSRIESFNELESRLNSAPTGADVSLDVKASYIGTKIFEMHSISKSYGEKKLIIDFTYNFARYDKMGIAGNNGTGKSTFLKLLIGEVAPDSGTIEIGESVRFGYYSQTGLEFDPAMKVIDVVTDIAEYIELGRGEKLTASQFLNKFLFPPSTQQNFVSKLSGGEKRRLYLCTILMRNPNFLILDEPTNDLDIPTLSILEEYLSGFKGCLIVVSHDRWFMDKVVNHLLVFREDGQIKDFPGSYSDYIDWKQQVDATQKQESSSNKPKIEERSKNRERKLSYKEQQELEMLEIEISELEQERRALETELSSGSLSAEVLSEKSTRIGEIITLIDNKTERWMELSEIK